MQSNPQSSPATRRCIYARVEDRKEALRALRGAEGLLVKTRVPIAVGEEIDLCLTMSDQPGRWFLVVVVVGRRPGQGLRVRMRTGLRRR